MISNFYVRSSKNHVWFIIMQDIEKYAVTKSHDKVVPTKFRNAITEVLMAVVTKICVCGVLCHVD
jgi:hypothetical protein